MKPSELAYRLRIMALLLTLTGAAIFWFTRPAVPDRPRPPKKYTAFTVDLDGEWIAIRNTGPESLTNCTIEFTARLDAPGGATYQGTRYFPSWEPGQAHGIGISTPRGPMDVLSVRFVGTAFPAGTGPSVWRLSFPAGENGGN